MSTYGQPRNPFAYPRLAFGDRRRRRAHRTDSASTLPAALTLDAIANPENLLRAYYRCRAEGGQAAGSDGLTYDHFGRSEAASAARAFSRAIRQRRYRPQPAREKRIPKTHGGYRTLRLPAVWNRAIARALAERLAKHLDPRFLSASMGFRPGRGIWEMLAELMAIIEIEDRPVLCECDIRAAFDSVRIDALMEAYRQHVHDEGVLWLIEAVSRGAEGSARTTGIDQGGAASPVSLNLLLHTKLDLPLSQAADPATPPWRRYADNVVFACQDESEGHQALAFTRHLLAAAGLELRRAAGPIDLRREGARIEILGFLLRRGSDGRPRLELDRKAWRKLERALERAHRTPDPPRMASEAVRGWISSLGPAFESVEPPIVLRETLRTAARMGFRDSLRQSELRDAYRTSRARWIDLRRRVYGRQYGHEQAEPQQAQVLDIRAGRGQPGMHASSAAVRSSRRRRGQLPVLQVAATRARYVDDCPTSLTTNDFACGDAAGAHPPDSDHAADLP